jgi:hypothetical protein
VVAAGTVLLTARRPIIGCGMLAVGVPLTTALGRDTVIPVLRPNEALLLLVVAGFILHHLWTRQRFVYTGLDLAVVIFAVGCVVIPWLVLLFGRTWMDFDTWRAVLGPLQFLVVYLCFAQLRLRDNELKGLLTVTLLVSVIIAVIAIMEVQDFPSGAKAALTSIFPPDHPPSVYDTVYRPSSTVGTYGAVGAFGTLNFLLALIVAVRRDSTLRKACLSTVMVLNLASVIGSLTWAPAAALLVGATAVIWYRRHVPKQIWICGGAMVVALIILWPAVSSRLEQQRVGLGSIQTVDQRLWEWQTFFLPVLADHEWFGTGTLVPSEVPTYMSFFVDNAYLRMGFRAGLVGLVLLFSMLSIVAVTGMRCRESPDPWRRRLGAAAVATVLTIILTGFTGEYLTCGGLSQYIAMMFGLLAARLRPGAQLGAPDRERDSSPGQGHGSLIDLARRGRDAEWRWVAKSCEVGLE